MGITRRDFLKILGVSSLPLLNFKNILKNDTEFEFTVISSKPIDTVTSLLNAIKQSSSKNIFLYGINDEAISISKYVLNRTMKGIYKGNSMNLFNKSALMAVMEIKRISKTAPGITMISGNSIVDPRRGVFSRIAQKVYNEKSGDFEIRIKVSSVLNTKKSNPGTKAKIMINGKTKGYINLNKNEKLNFSTNLGKIKIVSGSGMVRVEESSCKHKICMHRGYISNTGEKLICAPQKVVVEVIGKSLIDSIVG